MCMYVYMCVWERERRVAQSVQYLTMGWMTGQSRFDPRHRRKNFSSSLCVQTGSGPTQPPVQWVPEVLSPGIKRDQGVTLTTHPHLVPSSWMSWRYTSSPLCVTTGVLWDSFAYQYIAPTALNYGLQFFCRYILASLGILYYREKTDWRCFGTRCWGEYLDVRETK
jgi:hypothetical protein